MTTETVTAYRIYFPKHAQRTARRRLEEEGFTVTDATLGPSHALDARLVAAETDAAVKLRSALAEIEHDPLIEYQVERLAFIAT